MAVDCQRYCQWQQLRAAKKGPQQEAPVLKSFFTKHTQADVGTKNCQEALKLQWELDLWSFVLSQESLNTLIVILVGINVTHNAAISIP